MNSRRMMRTLTSAIPIAPTVIAAFGTSTSPPSAEPTPSCVSVIADRASQTAKSLTASPHHVDQGEDQDPEEVDRVPVRRARLDGLLGAPQGTPQLMDGDPQRDEADQQVQEMDRRQ